MKFLLLIVSLGLMLFSNLRTDSPHGAEFKITCSTCHSSKSWEIDKEIYSFDHNATQMPLTGQHTYTECRQCHPTLIFSEAQTECFSCHKDIHQGSVGFDCSRCHTPESWLVNNISLIHRAGRFPLLGAHKTADCYDCHKSESNTRFDVSGIECVDCHREDYNSTQNPNHIQAGISTDCMSCHSVASFEWSGTGFSHSFFPLTLGHDVEACTDCHTSSDYSTISAECYACHQPEYENSGEPNHSEAKFSINCIECHTTNPDWKPTQYNHSEFLLTLGHSGPTCADCHKGSYTNTSGECYACHQPDFLAAKDPDHVASGFPQSCTECHTTNPGWTPASFDHSSFPLSLGHSVPSCADCHKGNYINTSADCYLCHQQDFIGAKDPDHVASGFPQTCTNCHTTNPGWTPALYDHSSFPLTLGHSGPSCADCHKGSYINTSADCYACHQQDFLAAKDPDHVASGFPQTCTDCHTTNPGWTPASFNHSSFPLTLGHSGPSCADCHKGSYTNTPVDCYACHAADYNASVNPSHPALDFSTTCTICHTTNPDWKPATFKQHDSLFPIYSGRHQGNSCSDCHTNLSNYSVFSCINCHEHNKADMDDEHLGEVSGYSYNSSECFRCHPRGIAD